MNRDELINLMESKDKSNIEEAGGVTGICKQLGSDPESGIFDSSENSLIERRNKYGKNTIERKPPPGFLELFIEAMSGTIIIILMIAAIVSIIIGAIICAFHLGSVCPRKPFRDVGSLKDFHHVRNLFCLVG
jgi:magnesium-transporting ATPase (P-type)